MKKSEFKTQLASLIKEVLLETKKEEDTQKHEQEVLTMLNAIPKEGYNLEELKIGMAVESDEHGMSKEEAELTAKQHLLEHPFYYTALKEFESEVKLHKTPDIKDFKDYLKNRKIANDKMLPPDEKIIEKWKKENKQVAESITELVKEVLTEQKKGRLNEAYKSEIIKKLASDPEVNKSLYQYLSSGIALSDIEDSDIEKTTPQEARRKYNDNAVIIWMDKGDHVIATSLGKDVMRYREMTSPRYRRGGHKHPSSSSIADEAAYVYLIPADVVEKKRGWGKNILARNARQDSIQTLNPEEVLKANKTRYAQILAKRQTERDNVDSQVDFIMTKLFGILRSLTKLDVSEWRVKEKLRKINDQMKVVLTKYQTYIENKADIQKGSSSEWKIREVNEIRKFVKAQYDALNKEV